MRTSLKCKQESLRIKNSTPRKSPVGKFPSTAGGECRRISLPTMLVGETVGEILQANQFARQILAVVDNKTKNTSKDPKTPLTEHRKQRYQFLKSLMEKDDSKCGQNAVVERKTVLVPKSETIVHAIVTNVKTFDY